ncbi:MAG: PAS domain S-box protein [Phycisphaerae bacterium]
MAEERKRDFKILIVEDDILDAKLLKQQLTQTSINVTRVAHAERLEESLNMLKQEQFDIILLDMNLPDSNGLETLKQVHKAAPDLPIINVTGSTDEEMGLKAVSSGAQDYLIKGRFDPYILNKSIQYSLERKKMEEDTRRSEAKFRTLYESSSDAVMLLDEKGFFDCNDAAIKIFGCKDKEEFCTKHPGDLSPPAQPCGTDSMTLAKQRVAAAIETGSTRFEWLHKRLNPPEEFPAEVLLNSMELDGRKIVQAVVRDVTERKKAEQELQEERNKLRSLVDLIDNMDVGLTVQDRDYNIIYQNPFMQKQFGGLGTKCYKTYEARDTVCDGCPVAKAFKDGQPHKAERTTPAPDGGVFYWSNTAHPIKDVSGNITSCFEVVKGITEEKHKEQEIRDSRSKLNAMLGAISDHMTMVDRDFTIIWANMTAQSKFGEEIVGKKCYQAYHNSKDGCPKTKCSLKDCFETGKVQRWDSVVTDKQGQKLYFHSTASVATRDAEGKPQAVIQISRDVTEEKKAELALIEANKELAAANKGMRQMQGQLVQNEKLASIGQLAAGVAHEMNTPVGFVASNFVTLRNYVKKFGTILELYHNFAKETKSQQIQGCAEKLDEIENTWKSLKMDFICGDIENLFEESKEGLERVTSIIQNLRDFSRIDQAEDFVEYDLNSGMKATLIVARNEIKYDADLRTEFCDNLPVQCSSGQINQVFLNILVNASQAIKSQQKEEKGIIEIKTFAQDEWAVCTITDNGPGIPQDIINKIFDPFFTTKPAGKGTGLGLSVSHDIIVNKHKGVLEVESEMGKGTKFIIKLPLYGRQQKTEEAFEETKTNG